MYVVHSGALVVWCTVWVRRHACDIQTVVQEIQNVVYQVWGHWNDVAQ